MYIWTDPAILVQRLGRKKMVIIRFKSKQTLKKYDKKKAWGGGDKALMTLPLRFLCGFHISVSPRLMGCDSWGACASSKYINLKQNRFYITLCFI